VLLRLFQTSRRFNIEVQPQLVLLQKTLLNIEGLGRELDPELDLWETAKPFLERWMAERVGWRGFIEHLKQEAPYWSTILPQLPRLLHQALAGRAGPQPDPAVEDLRREKQAQTRLLAVVAGLLALIAAALFLQL
jgi:ubiquinone biosynthesis protein